MPFLGLLWHWDLSNDGLSSHKRCRTISCPIDFFTSIQSFNSFLGKNKVYFKEGKREQISSNSRYSFAIPLVKCTRFLIMSGVLIYDKHELCKDAALFNPVKCTYGCRDLASYPRSNSTKCIPSLLLLDQCFV